MKKFLLFLLSFFFVIFTSCNAGGAMSEELSQSLSSMTHAEYTAKITASFPSREATFVINYSHSPEGDRASVISPGEVAGVSYTVSDGGATLSFDDAILEIGKLSDGGLSPFSCTGDLIGAWKSGSFDEVTPTSMFGKEALLAITRKTENDTETEYRTWFSKEDFLPLYAEIFSDGNRVIQCEFERSLHNER
ncbi:MAG: hypothetical protein IIV97_01860 [Oscillospiraceae bacterium]|nr:hypothetical protein [Oscillospiraceae bacterium]